MLIVYEKEEGFFNKLKNIPDKINTRAFVSRVRDLSEDGILTASIVIQVVEGDDVRMFKYIGDLPKFNFTSFENISNETAKEQLKKEYNQSYLEFEQKIEEEYNKIVNLLKTMGYQNIENAVIS